MAKLLLGEVVIVADLRIAKSFLSRLRGLGAIRDFPDGKGLLIKPCNSVHTFWPDFAIDVVFLSADLRILRTCPRLKHRSFSPVVWRAHQVLELPAGTVERLGLARGQTLSLVS